MSVRFFGQFLLEKRLITARQLIEAAEYQESRNLKFGEYAVSKGFLTDEQVRGISREQMRSDMFFGEVAVKLGILAAIKVKEILTMQKNDRVFIGEVLVERGFIDRGTLERELVLFKAEQARPSDDEIIKLPEGIKRPDIVKEAVIITKRMLTRIANLNSKLDEIFISSKEPMIGYGAVTILMEGSYKLEYNLFTSPGVAREIARGLFGKDFSNEPEEVVFDSVGEFCNICCGNLTTRMAQLGHALDISPPAQMLYKDGKYKPVRGRKAVYCPLLTPMGDATLVLIV